MRSLFAYIRVSTVKQGERGSSLQEQRAAIESYARRHGLAISEWFEEKETAAKRGRQVFNRMLKALTKEQAAGVIIHKIDRGARNLRDWADLGELIDRGIEVHFAHESLDLNSRGGRLSADIQAVVAADFIRNLRDEVRKGFRGRLKQGLYPLPAPVGYQNKGRGLPKVPDPVSGPLVRRAFELYASGEYSLLTLGDELLRLGLRNRNGGRITRNGLSTLLNNPFYIGLIRVEKSGEMYAGIHEPLISKSLFDLVQDRLKGRKRNRGLKHVFLYRRSLSCMQCAHSLVGERQKGHVYYRCHTEDCPKVCLREEEIDAQIKEALAAVSLTPEDLTDIAQGFERYKGKRAANREQTLQAIKLNLSQLDDRLGRLTDAFIDRLIGKELFEERKAKLLHERTTIHENYRELLGGNDPIATEIDNFLELVKSLSDKENEANSLERRDLIKSATSNLSANGKNVVVSWKSPFNVLASREKTSYGEPHRDTRRTDHAALGKLINEIVVHFK